MPVPNDIETAAAFAASWSHCFSAAPYTREQYLEWIEPVRPGDLAGRRICELGCGHGGLLLYTAEYAAGGRVTGVDLGASAQVARRNIEARGHSHCRIVQRDLIQFARENAGQFDFVYCIGVLHHMDQPREGFRAVVDATAPGGRFHCWVYGHEGTALVRCTVEPIRRLACRLPWWFNKYCVALPLSVPFFLLSKTLHRLRHASWTDRFPMAAYFRHVGAREFAFHHHVAFDQLVTPRTVFLRRSEIEAWLEGESHRIEETYILPRNGNSWKFGGRRRR